MGFDLQLFADTVTASAELHMLFDRQNGKTQDLTMPNPRSDLTESEVKTVMSSIVNGKIILDKEESSFTSVFSAYIEEKSIRDLDLNANSN